MLGNKLKQLREARCLTQADIAKGAGVSRERYNQYENNRRAPDYDTLVILAKSFNVSTDYLLGNTDDPTPVRDVDQDLHDEHDYNQELDAFLKDDEMSSMFYDYKNWSEEEKRNLLNILKGQEALRELNKKK
ncbi:helix-turn-helix domain-containing protein [Acetobacterium malicum]|uniref:Helix-turn-helix domain-containing protein n=1 Tax=Acetobacterium malicum TaxID=52692 RepID=A0ABR6Z2L3_9FIRM|nr:helix-turn-helix transcriptional regulator [Acetobacterium malicum]MBC3901500.1 helix-turn-helix domain-containing protein [Acetobacterium malicum]